MRMRPFLLLVALLLTTGCASRETLTPAYAPLSLVVGFPACAEQAENGDCTLFEVSIVQLLARPELFAGKRVRVIGFVNLEFEGNALYLSRELFEHGGSRDAIWVDVEGLPSAMKFRRGYALVEGTFSAGPSGHFGMFSGQIAKITRFEPWSVRRTMQ